MVALIRKIFAGPIALVMATILLQLAAAWVLAGVASSRRGAVLLALGAVAASIALNLVRFFLWRIIHQRYPLSHSYPLTALFFPCILALSWLRGDPVSLPQMAGTLLITAGAIVLVPSQAGGGKT